MKSKQRQEDKVCECGHTHFDHEGLTGEICLKPGCKCGMFAEANASDSLF